MRILKSLLDLDKAPRNAVVTIGNFDGVHLGHRSILDRLKAHKAKIDGEIVLLTFKPHPQMALRPEKALELINTYEEKLEILSGLGADIIIEQPFSREFSNQSAEDFVVDILQKRLRAQVVLLGYDFAFGKGRRGNANLVRKLLEPENVVVEEASPLELDGAAVSSSRIRHALDQGDIQEANACLGREFFLSGIVSQGEGRGKKIGIPTANIQTEPRKIPGIGVYATTLELDGKVHASVTNIGLRPTFSGETKPQLTIESHLYDYQGHDFYGRDVKICFQEFIRGEQRFNGSDELKSQISKDISKARKIVAR